MSTASKPGETSGARSPAPRSSVTPSQRAAVIIAMLGEAAAKPIVEKLDDVALAKVVSAMESISYLPREELVEIVIDFLTHLRSSTGALRGGPSRARELMGGLVNEQRLSTVLGGERPADTEAAVGDTPLQDGDVWTRLRQKEPEAIAQYLSGLTPNIIALILRRLDSATASDVLTHLDDEKLVPMMGYLVDGEKPDPGIESVISRMIEIEFLNAAQEAAGESTEHLETIGELLSLIPDGKRESLVQFLKTEHEAKLRSIEKAMLTIESLPEILPRSAVPVVFRELDPETVQKIVGGLQASHRPVAEFLLGNISSRMADQIRDELEDFKPLSPIEAETMQREFLSTLMGMRQRGLITIEKPAEPEA